MVYSICTFPIIPCRLVTYNIQKKCNEYLQEHTDIRPGEGAFINIHYVTNAMYTTDDAVYTWGVYPISPWFLLTRTV